MFSMSYAPHESYDELFLAAGEPRVAAERVTRFLSSMSQGELQNRQRDAETDIRTSGITFAVYEQESPIDRQWPFDIIPRVISAREWRRIEQGLKQRLQALNLFIDDLYNEQRVIHDGIFPREVLESSPRYLKVCHGVKPRFGAWAHIGGSDLVRDRDGTVYVLEDNLRVPSGVSYMLENRTVTKRVFPELFEHQHVQPIDGYTSRLYDLLLSLAPASVMAPTIVLLTPGVYNSAYFEHCYLAQHMGIELVEGRDLIVDSEDCVYMKTIEGLQQVHVIYRRVDDAFLDPEVFNPASLLGSAGLMRAWKRGNVTIVNAPGAGVADDKLVYSYVPELIRYYLDQDAILPNVPTFRMIDSAERAHVLADLKSFVIKPTNEAGGYGVLVGASASEADLERYRSDVMQSPRNWVAQPIIQLSTAPTLCGDKLEPRHLDLRPFVLSGEKHYVTRGGLTRVALRRGSLIVNSSQGGGSKDTWVVED